MPQNISENKVYATIALENIEGIRYSTVTTGVFRLGNYVTVYIPDGVEGIAILDKIIEVCTGAKQFREREQNLLKIEICDKPPSPEDIEGGVV